MNIFRKIGNAIARFMYGRNGMDQLNVALFGGYIAYCVVRAILLIVLESRAVMIVSDILLYAFMLLIFYRMFSKNLYKRRAENQKWVNWVWRMKSSRNGARERHADKEHKYFTCKDCKTICRVPVGKGKIVITCPKCGAQIQAKT